MKTTTQDKDIYRPSTWLRDWYNLKQYQHYWDTKAIKQSLLPVLVILWSFRNHVILREWCLWQIDDLMRLSGGIQCGIDIWNTIGRFCGKFFFFFWKINKRNGISVSFICHQISSFSVSTKKQKKWMRWSTHRFPVIEYCRLPPWNEWSC